MSRQFWVLDLPAGVAACEQYSAWFLDDLPAAGVNVMIRQRYFRRPNGRWAAPPLRVLASSARGAADVRVRMAMWLLFTQSHPKGQRGVEMNATNWARLLNLPLGARRPSSLRRLTSARDALHATRWLAAPKRGLLTLTDPSDGRTYAPETEQETSRRLALRRQFINDKSEGQVRYHPVHWEDGPVAVPAELWANGWITVLSGKAILVYVVLCNHRTAGGLAVVPKIRTHQYSIGKDLWLTAIDELVRLRLVRTHNQRTIGNVTHFDYELRDDTLAMRPPPRLFA